MEETLVVLNSQGHSGGFTQGVMQGGLQKGGQMIVGDAASNAASEEVFSNYDYPNKYKGPNRIRQQIFTIADTFDLRSVDSLVYVEQLPVLPHGADGYFAWPKLSAIAKTYFPFVHDEAEQYCEAVELVNKKLADTFHFNDYCNTKLVPANYRLDQHTLKCLKELESSQQGDIVIVAAQYGLRHRGRSVQKVRQLVEGSNEFGLGAFHVACMTLTHPERYCCRGELDTECPGDEIRPSTNGDFTHTTSYSHSGGKLGFDVGSATDAYERFGSVTAFLP